MRYFVHVKQKMTGKVLVEADNQAEALSKAKRLIKEEAYTSAQMQTEGIVTMFSEPAV